MTSRMSHEEYSKFLKDLYENFDHSNHGIKLMDVSKEKDGSKWAIKSEYLRLYSKELRSRGFRYVPRLHGTGGKPCPGWLAKDEDAGKQFLHDVTTGNVTVVTESRKRSVQGFHVNFYLNVPLAGTKALVNDTEVGVVSKVEVVNGRPSKVVLEGSEDYFYIKNWRWAFSKEDGEHKVFFTN